MKIYIFISKQKYHIYKAEYNYKAHNYFNIFFKNNNLIHRHLNLNVEKYSKLIYNI
ncbi:MAG: hypothetical protein K0Q97_432 [Bacillota bacterium]|jgi:hypothetical protein|nr:hypothetical protein [Bacillota bacterium]